MWFEATGGSGTRYKLEHHGKMNQLCWFVSNWYCHSQFHILLNDHRCTRSDIYHLIGNMSQELDSFPCHNELLLSYLHKILSNRHQVHSKLETHSKGTVSHLSIRTCQYFQQYTSLHKSDLNQEYIECKKILDTTKLEPMLAVTYWELLKVSSLRWRQSRYD